MELSLSQHEVWLDQMAWPGSGHLMIGGGGFLDGPLDLALCHEALRKLVALHDGLRLAPLAQGGQILLDSYDPPLPLIDLAPGLDPLQTMQAWWQDNVRRPFILDGQPPWRSAMWRCHGTLHGLAMQFHHTVMDGWGASQVMRQLSDIYNLLCVGGTLPVPPAFGYASYVEDSRAYANSEAFARDAAYWKQQIGQLPAALFERRVGVTRGATLPQAHTLLVPLDRYAYTVLREQATRQERTVFGFFLAAIALYFARVAERSSVLIGVPTLNRGGRRYLHTPGMFVGVLALQLTVAPQQSVASLLGAAAAAMRGALRHPRYPLSALGRQLDLVRSGRAGVFDVLLSFEQQDHEVHFGAALRVDSRQFFSGLARYPLGITVCEFHDSHDPELILEASNEYFLEEDVALVARRIWHVTRYLAAHPDALVQDVPILPPEERSTLIETAAASVTWHATTETYVAAFERHAAEKPEAIALVWDGGSWDYATLNHRANQLAHRLAALGTARERIVAVALPRSPDLVLAMLAIAKAGAAYLPLDPEAPVARLSAILQECDAVALLIQDAGWERLAQLHPRTVVMGWQQALSGLPGEHPPAHAAADDLAYVLFTSGSSGRPKGVMVEHGTLARRMAWLSSAYQVREQDRSALATQATFDPSLIELCLPLVHGASIAVAPPGRLLPQMVAEFAIRHGVTIMAFVPSTLGGFLDVAEQRPGLRLRVACCGGEVLAPDLARRFVQATGARLFNVYGPTEACIFATAWECDGKAVSTALSIGAPVDDTCIYVLRSDLQLQPVGVAGEIHIGGTALARGYLNRPELNAQVFLPDPFRPGGRMYRTGDRGWIDLKGQLHFVGRLDRQVKLRGYRIELGEIEAALLAIEGVAQSAAKLVERDGRAMIHAWVATGSGTGPDALQRVLRARLPDYMIPSAIGVLPELPLGGAGKVDYDALPQVTERERPLATAQPANQLERDLLALWEDVLERRPLSVQDNFFDVGGDSLAAVSILAGAERLLGRRIPLYLLTEHPTISSLVAALVVESDPHGLVVAMSTGAASMPFYLAASGHGDRMRFSNLAAPLSGVCSLNMLQPPQQDMPTRIRELAAMYAQQILARGTGPCYVGGFSVGGVAALETARLLRQRGVDVRGLILIETVYPKVVWGGTFYWRLFRWLVLHLRIQDMSLNGRRLGAMFNDAGLVGQVMAMTGYRPTAFEGTSFLIKTRGLSRWHGMLFRSWRKLLGAGLSEHLVPGMHGSVFEPPNVGALAEVITVIVRSHPAVATR